MFHALTRHGLVPALIALSPAAEAATLTVLISNAQATATTLGDSVVRNGPIAESASVGPAGSNVSSASLAEGALRVFTTNRVAEGIEEPVRGSSGASVGAGLSVTFRYNGTAPLTLPAGSIRYRAEGDFLRRIFDGGPGTIANARTAAQTSFGLRRTVVPDVGSFARVDVSETATSADGETVIDTTRTDPSGLIEVFDARQNGFAFAFAAPEITLSDGDTLALNATLNGTAGQSITCGISLSTCPSVQALVDADNTGLLSLVVPEGVTVARRPGDPAFDWISTSAPPAVIPLPAGIWLLGAALAGLVGLTPRRPDRRRRHRLAARSGTSRDDGGLSAGAGVAAA